MEWLRFFRCNECLVDYRLVMGQLYQGKLRRETRQVEVTA